MNGSALIEFKVLKIDFLKLLTEEEKQAVQHFKQNIYEPNQLFKKERELKILNMELKQSKEDILNICFEEKDKYHKKFGNTIRDFIERECVEQLFNYYSQGIPETKEFQFTMNLYVVILVGGRRLLVAEVDKTTKNITYTIF